MIKPIKICQNPDCGDEIVAYKSSKINYCNDYCRNRAGYLRRKEENKEFDEINKGHKQNYKVLKLHSDAGILSEYLSKFEKLGFDTRFLPEQLFFSIEGKNTLCYQLKDIIFRLDEEDNKIKIYKKKTN